METARFVLVGILATIVIVSFMTVIMMTLVEALENQKWGKATLCLMMLLAAVSAILWVVIPIPA